MRYTEYHAGKTVIKDKNKLSEAMEKLAEFEDKEESGGWIPCSERLPEFEEIENERPYLKNYKTKEVLVQTKRGEMFVAWNHKKVYTIGNFKDEYSWYSQGTGGRRMRVMSKVVAWMPLSEPYKGE